MVHKEWKEQIIWNQSCLSHLLAVWPWEHYLTSLNCSGLIHQKKCCTRSHWGSTDKKCQRWFLVHSQHSVLSCSSITVCVCVCVCVTVESQSGVSPGLTAAFSCTVAPAWLGSPAKRLPWPYFTIVPAFSPFSTRPMASVWLWCDKGNHGHITGDLWLHCCYDSLLEPLQEWQLWSFHKLLSSLSPSPQIIRFGNVVLSPSCYYSIRLLLPSGLFHNPESH